MSRYNLYKKTAITVDCGIPIQPVNGILGSYSSTKERANVTFQCNEEFVLPSSGSQCVIALGCGLLHQIIIIVH